MTVSDLIAQSGRGDQATGLSTSVFKFRICAAKSVRSTTTARCSGSISTSCGSTTISALPAVGPRREIYRSDRSRTCPIQVYDRRDGGPIRIDFDANPARHSEAGCCRSPAAFPAAADRADGARSGDRHSRHARRRERRTILRTGTRPRRGPACSRSDGSTLPDAFAAQALRTPDAIALVCEEREPQLSRARRTRQPARASSAVARRRPRDHRGPLRRALARHAGRACSPSSRPAAPTCRSTRSIRPSASPSCWPMPARRCWSRSRACSTGCRRDGADRPSRRRSSRRSPRQPDMRPSPPCPDPRQPRLRHLHLGLDRHSPRASRSPTATSCACSTATRAAGSASARDDVWTLFHSFAFDFSVWEIWGALLYGGRLVVVPYAVSRSPDAASRACCVRERVTVLNQTPVGVPPARSTRDAKPPTLGRSSRCAT